MTLEAWLLFLGAVVAIAGTPGPNVLFVTTRSIRHGLGTAGCGMAGCLLALVLMLVGSVAGLSALLLALPSLFEALRWAGAAYLVWLGIRLWRNAGTGDGDSPTQDREESRAAVFRTGFLIGLSNPKLLVFTAAFFPQFIDPTVPWAPQFAEMVATFVAVELAFYLAYAAGGRRLAGHLLRGPWRRRLDRASAVVFVGFGLVLLRARP
ncbi:MAG: LysE family translocator [Reyranellaceae bacterium]